MIQSLRSIKPVRMDEPVFPLSVEQYHEMIRTGILTDDDPVELLEGGLVFRMGKNPPHSFVTQKLVSLMSAALPAGWFYQAQEPVTLADGEPEPDGAVVRGRNEDYLSRHPGPADAAIVIEVADSTLSRDRGIKLRSYARARIETYWIVNLVERQIETYSDPVVATEAEPRYALQQTFTPGDEVPAMLNGHVALRVKVCDLFP